MSADNTQVAGDHYKKLDIQPWTAMEAWMPREQFIGFLRGNAIKYLARAGHKDELSEAVAKAKHYCEKLLECLAETPEPSPQRELFEQPSMVDHLMADEIEAEAHSDIPAFLRAGPPRHSDAQLVRHMVLDPSEQTVPREQPVADKLPLLPLVVGGVYKMRDGGIAEINCDRGGEYPLVGTSDGHYMSWKSSGRFDSNESWSPSDLVERIS